MSVSLMDKFFFAWWMVQDIPAQCDCHKGPKPQGVSLWHFRVTSEDVLKQSLSPNHHSWHKTNLRTLLLQGLQNKEVRFCRKASISAAGCLLKLVWLTICPAFPSFWVMVFHGWHQSMARWNYCCEHRGEAQSEPTPKFFSAEASPPLGPQRPGKVVWSSEMEDL